jgi:2-oxoglutarate ferredoxin oxidoreductase subunit alpha
VGVLFFGTSTYSTEEAMDQLREKGVYLDAMRLKAFPFSKSVEEFIAAHQTIFVIEQNRDAQMRGLLMLELQTDPAKLIPVLNYDGMPITAHAIASQISRHLLLTTPQQNELPATVI